MSKQPNSLHEVPRSAENLSGVAARSRRLDLAMHYLGSSIHSMTPVPVIESASYSMSPYPIPSTVVSASVPPNYEQSHYVTDLSQQELAIQAASAAAYGEARDSTDQLRDLREGLGHGVSA
jgi:hypothetical protein